VEVSSGDELSILTPEQLTVISSSAAVHAHDGLTVTGADVSVDATTSASVFAVEDISLGAGGDIIVDGGSVTVSSDTGLNIDAADGIVTRSGSDVTSSIDGDITLVSDSLDVTVTRGHRVVSGGEMSLMAAENAKLATPGAAVGLTPALTASVIHVDSPASFDDFEMTIDPVVRATEVVLQSAQDTPVAVGPATIMIQLYDTETSAWVDVWSTVLGAGTSYSLDGLSIEFTTLVVGGVRMVADPASGHSFQGFDNVFLHFMVWDGAIELSADSSIRSYARDDITMSSQYVRVTADDAEVTAIDSLTMSATDASVRASSVSIDADDMSFYATNDTEVVSGGMYRVSADELEIQAPTSANIVSTDLSVTSETTSAYLGATDILAQSAEIGAAEDMSVYALGDMAVTGDSISLSSGSRLDGFANVSTITSAEIEIKSTTLLQVEAGDISLSADGSLSASSADSLELSAQSLSGTFGAGGDLTFAEDVSVTSGGAVEVSSGDE
jgi:hypothetical protein